MPRLPNTSKLSEVGAGVLLADMAAIDWLAGFAGAGVPNASPRKLNVPLCVGCGASAAGAADMTGCVDGPNRSSIKLSCMTQGNEDYAAHLTGLDGVATGAGAARSNSGVWYPLECLLLCVADTKKSVSAAGGEGGAGAASKSAKLASNGAGAAAAVVGAPKSAKFASKGAGSGTCE